MSNIYLKLVNIYVSSSYYFQAKASGAGHQCSNNFIRIRKCKPYSCRGLAHEHSVSGNEENYFDY